MAGKIFVNYRRDDAPGDARGVRDGLAQKFGDSSLFMIAFTEATGIVAHRLLLRKHEDYYLRHPTPHIRSRPGSTISHHIRAGYFQLSMRS